MPRHNQEAATERTCVVVVGAGASAACANASSRSDSAWRPPLARELFDVGSRPEFESILLAHRGAQVLATELAEQARRDSFDLEASLRQFAKHPNEKIRQHYLDIPPYLCQVLTECSTRFTETPGTYVRLLIGLLTSGFSRVVFVSLNYDNLLEQALALFDEAYAFHTINDYIDPERAAWVIKPHGSITWRIQRTPHTTYDLAGELASVRYELPSKPWPIRIGKPNQVYDETFYPALTAPLASKTERDFVCPNTHLEALTIALRVATSILFVGTSAQDHHLLQYMNQRVSLVRRVHIVVDAGADNVAGRVLKGIPRILPGTITPLDVGFVEYVGANGLKSFLADDY